MWGSYNAVLMMVQKVECNAVAAKYPQRTLTGTPICSSHSSTALYVTQRQLMRHFVVKLILSYEQKCKVRSKFLKY